MFHPARARQNWGVSFRNALSRAPAVREVGYCTANTPDYPHTERICYTGCMYMPVWCGQEINNVTTTYTNIHHMNHLKCMSAIFQFISGHLASYSRRRHAHFDVLLKTIKWIIVFPINDSFSPKACRLIANQFQYEQSVQLLNAGTVFSGRVALQSSDMCYENNSLDGCIDVREFLFVTVFWHKMKSPSCLSFEHLDSSEGTVHVRNNQLHNALKMVPSAEF